MKCPCIKTKDTSTVLLTGDGSVYDPIKGHVHLSSAPGNCLQLRPDGLFSACGSGPPTPPVPPLPLADEPGQVLVADGGNDPSWTGRSGTFNTLALGPGASVGISTKSTAIGVNASALSGSDTALGAFAEALGGSSVAVGADALSDRGGSVSLGVESEATSENAVAVGWEAEASAVAGIALGSGAEASEVGAIALGAQAVANALGGAAIGTLASASGVGSVAIGAGASSNHEGSIVIAPAINTSGQERATSSGDYRATIAVQELEVGHPTETAQMESALLLRDSAGSKWRLSVDTSGNLQIASA